MCRINRAHGRPSRIRFHRMDELRHLGLRPDSKQCTRITKYPPESIPGRTASCFAVNTVVVERGHIGQVPAAGCVAATIPRPLHTGCAPRGTVENKRTEAYT